MRRLRWSSLQPRNLFDDWNVIRRTRQSCQSISGARQSVAALFSVRSLQKISLLTASSASLHLLRRRSRHESRRASCSHAPKPERAARCPRAVQAAIPFLNTRRGRHCSALRVGCVLRVLLLLLQLAQLAVAVRVCSCVARMVPIGPGDLQSGFSILRYVRRDFRKKKSGPRTPRPPGGPPVLGSLVWRAEGLPSTRNAQLALPVAPVAHQPPARPR
jgi:hypothetical protein